MFCFAFPLPLAASDPIFPLPIHPSAYLPSICLSYIHTFICMPLFCLPWIYLRAVLQSLLTAIWCGPPMKWCVKSDVHTSSGGHTTTFSLSAFFDSVASGNSTSFFGFPNLVVAIYEMLSDGGQNLLSFHL
ncbi:succinate dehydrogenase [ubiquinone] iron-sulfur subunit 3 [Pyrus ussuriensis x Pyrus communis]|uniref:Succinate dehydrogenase [ubiquinone] iron-sulfur subunit 3 n=1 Tax=Pyrus ussuriensis x Pyrus communis TaxID=2448454 RepID=A0A5N5HXJ6_9ROSA|nr:succinate dehydrogenase [ubiquinone] iron-sulfur subunit 3 [Pyrus ussuriensis x Pyrus communis]